MWPAWLVSIFLLVLLADQAQWACRGLMDPSTVTVTAFPPPSSDVSGRTFRIDNSTNQFLKDGQPFRYVGGSFHYFRARPESWQRKLRTMRAAGLMVVTTYVEWSLHNPRDGVYDWTGAADVETFIDLAEREDLLVVLRPGPYICAERDMGGFPYWLLTKYPSIKLRTMDADYLREVRRWYDVLMVRLQSRLYENGGPIIMVQVENEYGSYKCDAAFRAWMRAETERHVRGKAVLFTNDGPSQTRCGKIPGVLATLDFGDGSASFVDSCWATLRRYEPHGPLVNSEYYPGWLSHWQEPKAGRDIGPVVNSFRYMLQQNASVNFYMFFGGTNFGFTAGANNGGPGAYNADLTSYDYDAPMDEAGDPTDKYHALRAVIAEFFPMPNISVPLALPKLAVRDPVLLDHVADLLAPMARNILGKAPMTAHTPNVSFEALDQYSGFVLYETELPARFERDPSVLRVPQLHDRAIVLIDRRIVGTLSRENRANEMPISAAAGGVRTLQLLVENQGRINYAVAEDFKGILGAVTLNGAPLLDWTITGMPFDEYANVAALIRRANALSETERLGQLLATADATVPAVFYGAFELPADAPLYDTYLDPSGWGKGVAFVNGFNLGRYWPLVGSQVTLYVPREVLHAGSNNVTLVELQQRSIGGALRFVDKPQLNGF